MAVSMHCWTRRPDEHEQPQCQWWVASLWETLALAVCAQVPCVGPCVVALVWQGGYQRRSLGETEVVAAVEEHQRCMAPTPAQGIGGSSTGAERCWAQTVQRQDLRATAQMQMVSAYCSWQCRTVL